MSLYLHFSLRGRLYYSENSLKKNKKQQLLIKYRAQAGNKETFIKHLPLRWVLQNQDCVVEEDVELRCREARPRLPQGGALELKPPVTTVWQ